MLVAALAFAFHAGAVAASALGVSAAVGQSASHHQDEGSRSHDHTASHHDHVHAAGNASAYAAGAPGDHDHRKGHCKTNCCGAACTLAVLSTPAFQVSRIEVSSVLIGSFVPVLSSIDPSSLKRPPRTPNIA
jgi:hypothetical protein